MQPSLRLSPKFDPDRLQEDLRGILTADYVPHFNVRYYEGGLERRAAAGGGGGSVGGGAKQIYPDPTAKGQFSDTAPLLARCPYVRRGNRILQMPAAGAIRFPQAEGGAR